MQGEKLSVFDQPNTTQEEEENEEETSLRYDNESECIEIEQPGVIQTLCNSPFSTFDITKPLYDMIKKYKEVRVELDPDMFHTKVKGASEEEFLKAYLGYVCWYASENDEYCKSLANYLLNPSNWNKINDDVKYLVYNGKWLYVLVKYNGLYYLMEHDLYSWDFKFFTPFYVYSWDTTGGGVPIPEWDIPIPFKVIEEGDAKKIVKYFDVELKFKNGKYVEE